MPTPVFLVAGLHEEPMVMATLGLQCDLPGSVVVRHELEVAARSLRRTISDLSGVLEREEVRMEHACTSCAVREDILPTLERLAQLDRWAAIVVHLPIAADALSVCRVLARDRTVAPSVRVGGVVAALDGATVLRDLLEDDLIAERHPRAATGDHRGVGEVLAAMVEHADLVTVLGATSPVGLDLVARLARPGVPVCRDWPDVPPAELLAGVHDHAASEAWISQVYRGPDREVHGEHAWRMELVSEVPLHPQRLRSSIDRLGAGRTRSRGCFWLVSRPDQIGVWDGAGGLLSIGVNGSWGPALRFTRVLVTGTHDHDVRAELRRAFADAVLTDAELRSAGPHWETAVDGLETWLGPITRAA